MSKISVVIPTYNSEDLLGRCLSSIKWANEIIVIDMGSTDKTVEIAKKFGAKIYKRIPLNGNFDLNRKYGMQLCKGDWILKLDSDEVLSSELQDEIKTFLKNDTKEKANGFYFYNRLFWFGLQIKHGCVKPKSHELRLVRNGHWQYEPFCFHQLITVNGKVGFFKNYYDHYNYRTVSEFIQKTNNYTSLDSKIIASAKRYGFTQSIFFPFATFFRLYFFQKGFIDGNIGFISSFLFSFYNFVLKTKVWEQHNCKQ